MSSVKKGSVFNSSDEQKLDPAKTNGSDVTSVFGRDCDVVAMKGDYKASLLLNDSLIEGETVKDALENVKDYLEGDFATLNDENQVEQDPYFVAPTDPNGEKWNFSMREALSSLFIGEMRVNLNIQGETLFEVGSEVPQLYLNWNQDIGQGHTRVSQVVDGGVGTVPLSETGVFVEGPFMSDKTWALTIGSDQEETKSDSAGIKFSYKRYIGTTEKNIEDLSDSDIKNLSINQLKESKSYNSDSFNFGEKKLVIAYPASLGELSNVIIGGFDDTPLSSNYDTEIREGFINESGASLSLRVYVKKNTLNGLSSLSIR